MKLTETIKQIDNYPNPDQFREKLSQLDSQLKPILDDFKKYYVFFNKNPDYPEYQQMFQNIKGNLANLNSELFKLSNSVQFTTEELNEKLQELNILIAAERKRNKELKHILSNIDNKNNAASELISDYTTIYDINYLRNWGLFLSIMVAVTAITSVYKSSSTV